VDSRLAPFLQIELDWAIHNRWPAGYRLQQQITAVSLWLVLQGEIEVKLQGQSWRVQQNDAFLSPSDSQRELHLRQDSAWLSLGLRATLFGRIDMTHTLSSPRLWQPAPDERALLETAMRHITLRESESLVREGLTRAVWGLCWQDVDLASAPEQMPAWLQHSLQQMHERPGISIAELARDAGWSAAQFRRHFHHWVGMSPREYSSQQRLQAARGWLENTDWSIAEIGERLGFLDASQFSRVFKQATNSTPQNYRRLAKQRETALKNTPL
jgi:AraC-like DNA-binding protein